MTVPTASTHAIAFNADPGFGATLKSEWTKLRSVRSTWIIVALAIVLSIGFSALVAFVTALTFDAWGESGQASFDPVLSSMAGLLFSLVLLIVLGVTAVTSEYSSKTIRATFIVNPRRIRVFAAKATVVGALGVAISAIAAPGMFLVGQALYESYGYETARLTDSDATRVLIVYALVVGLTHTLIPFSIAYLLRGAASAITASVGLFFLPWMLGPILPAWMQQNVLRYLPDLALDSLAGITTPGAATYLSQTPAMIVIASWLAGSLVVAAAVLHRRDA